jgi:hypothetical protein
VPFYAMVHTGLSSFTISSIFALVHSVIFWLTFELALCVCPSNDRLPRLTFGICAIILAAVNPILIQQIGSTFADITTAELLLGGWLLLAQAVRAPTRARVICAGLLLGVATALKPTNSVHAISAFALFIMFPLDLWGRLRQGIVCGLSAGAGFAIVAAPWSYSLYKMFGNPMFPLMNNVFRSPEFTTEPLRHFRFIPFSLGEALWRPFAIVDPVRMVQEELSSPDLRYAVLVVLVFVLIVRWGWRRFSRRPKLPTAEGSIVSGRVLAALGCGFGVDWVMWLSASGNGRYFLPMACIASVLIVGLLLQLATRTNVRNYALAAIFGVQGVQLWMGAEFRWNEIPWQGPWLSVQVPDKLRNEPSLYLTEGAMSNSFIAAYLAKGSGLINFTGGYPLGPDGASGARIAALIKHYSPNLRVLAVGKSIYEDSDSSEPHRSQIDAPLMRFGLRIDTTDCATISISGPQLDKEAMPDDTKADQQSPRNIGHLVSCRIVVDTADRSAELAQQHDADIILDRLEDACPKLFQPRRALTERRGRAWIRHYFNTDVWGWVSQGGVKFYQANSGIFRTWVGSESDWARAPLQLSCGRRDNIYFAKVPNSGGARRQ